jgi:hypothetical protein
VRRLPTAFVTVAISALAAAPAFAVDVPTVVHDVKTGSDDLGSKRSSSDDIQDYTQPDTQIEPSIAINPANPLNVVTVYQEGRIANGGDATNGFATTFDGGKTWTYGELPGLTIYPGQNGPFERASDAVVAFGPDNTVYANSLVFDFSIGNGLRSGLAVNVSKDGGAHWGPPVFFQDDNLGGTNDKNWIVVDNSDAPGHHKGRVYVVWDRIAPVVYDYCDHDCDQLSNWLPNLQTLSGLLFPAQGIGAYPLVMPDGSLGIVLDTLTPGVPTSLDQPDIEPGGEAHVFISAPLAGSTPFPAPLVFGPPVQIAVNRTAGQPAQRGTDGLPSADVDPKSGAIYVVWDDQRFRSDGTNDAVLSTSTDGGITWTGPVRVNPGPTNDHVDHYGVTVAVGDGGVVHVAYRQRDESGKPPLFTDEIDTYCQQSRDGGKTFSAPLKVNSKPSNPWYGAFSRDGTFEGDYYQTASVGGYTYTVRTQGELATPGEPPALTPNGPSTIALTDAGKGHQHQSAWVALIRDLPPGSGTATTPARLRLKLTARRLRHGRVRLSVSGKDVRSVKRVTFLAGKKRLARDTHSPFTRVVKLGKHTRSVRATVLLRTGRTLRLSRKLR